MTSLDSQQIIEQIHDSAHKLVLSLDRSSALVPIRWDRATIQSAVRAGLVRSVSDARARGTLPSWIAAPLEKVVARAPVSELLSLLGRIRGFLG